MRAALSAALVAGSTAIAVSFPGAASAIDLAVTLPIASFGDIAVDSAGERVYISDPVGGKLVTTDFTGAVLDTSVGNAGISGLTLDKNGDVYAASPTGKTIVAFSEAGKRMNTFPAGGDVAPATMAEAAGKLWFGQTDGGLGRFDSTGEEPGGVPDILDTPFGKAPALAGRGNLIAATDPTAAAGTVTVLDVTTAATALVPPVTKELGQTRDLAFTADGSRLLVTGPKGLARAVRPTDLSTIQTYDAGADGTAVAVRRDGRVAVGVGGTTSKAVSVFAPGSATPTQQFNLAGPGTLQPGGLAWQPDGPRLFGVSGNGSTYTLQILGDPGKHKASVKLTVPSKVERGKSATVTAVFAAPIPVGLPVVVTRTDSAGSRRVGPQTVPAGGRITMTDKPPRSGKVTYHVEFAGNTDYSAAGDVKSFQVGTVTPTTLTLDRNGSTYAAGSTVTFTAKLGATHSSRTVEIWADPYGGDLANRLVRRATVNSRGVMTASFKLTRTTTMSAIFRGDTFTSARTVRSTVATRVSVSVALDKHYGTGAIGSVPYHFLRSNVDPRFVTSMSPYPGRKAFLEVEYYNGKQWLSWRSAYSPLYDGKAYNELTGTHTVGAKYRVRASYVYSKSGDTVNTTTYGAYKYFTFTR